MATTIHQHFQAVKQPSQLRAQLVSVFDSLEDKSSLADDFVKLRAAQEQAEHHLMFVYAACSKDDSIYWAWLSASSKNRMQLWEKIEQCLDENRAIKPHLRPLLLKYAASLMDQTEAVVALHDHMQTQYR